MLFRGQACERVANLVDLASLDGRVLAECLANRIAESSAAIDDEEPLSVGVEAAFDSPCLLRRSKLTSVAQSQNAARIEAQ